MLTLFMEKNMKIAICDDEKIFVDNIVQHLDFFSTDNSIDFEKYIFDNPSDVMSSNINFDIAKRGVFEYIIDEAGRVCHQVFKEGGYINGAPN